MRRNKQFVGSARQGRDETILQLCTIDRILAIDMRTTAGGAVAGDLIAIAPHRYGLHDIGHPHISVSHKIALHKSAPPEARQPSLRLQPQRKPTKETKTAEVANGQGFGRCSQRVREFF
jgi:hypothetical protein